MKAVKIYSLENCPYCERAKALFKGRGVAFEEIKVDRGNTVLVQALAQQTGMRTFPQIFIGDQLVGGFSELDELNREGRLEAWLREDFAAKKAGGCGCH